MENTFSGLPDNIQEHLRAITKSSGLPDTEESLEKVSQNWIEKRDLFEKQIKSLDMVEVFSLDNDDPRGALMLTYSGSLIALGTLQDSKRWMEYYSIKLRHDVPNIIKNKSTQFVGNAGIDKVLEFTDGSLKNTSALYTIAVCKETVSPDEQETRLHEATIFLTNGFVKINRSLLLEDDQGQMQFTNKSIITQVANRNDISQKNAKKIITDYLNILESGMLLGERVPLGKMGKLSLRLRPPQKARIGKNFATGEEITIKAKPEMAVPKISFSGYMKERAAKIDLGKYDDSSDTDDYDDES